MSVQNNRRREPGKAGSGMGVAWLAGGVLIIALSIYGAVRIGSQVDGVNPDMSTDPSEFFSVVVDVFKGALVWPATATLIVSVIGAVLVFFAVLVLMTKTAGRKNRTNADRAARYMAPVRDLEGMQQREAVKKSERLGVTGSPGIPVGRMVLGARMVFASFEDMMILIAGPRVGKSTSLVIPAIVAAPGAVVTTSNKRDVLDATRDLRKERGDVWVFDPQRVAGEDATWWWNPLSYVTDDTKAAKLAEHFASGTTASTAKTDAFFEGKGKDLLAGLLLAAAVGNRPITDVYDWLTDVSRTEQIRLLEDAGYKRMADSVTLIQRMVEKPRDSVYASAERMAACLKNTGIEKWVNEGAVPVGPYAIRKEFHPTEFVKNGTGTLYCLSKEGAGTAGPLVTALTAATIEAAEEFAAESPGGRLQTPLLGLLDEAANVCRWTDLPDLYSHFGSRGIPIMSVFQSYSQGVAVFGVDGMRKLWSASNVKVYAGGVSEPAFLGEMSDLIGTYDRETTSVSMNKGIRSTSSSLKREKILEVQELADMPRGRAVMFSSGNRAVLLRTVPWFKGAKETVAAIRASIKAHEPGRQR